MFVVVVFFFFVVNEHGKVIKKNNKKKTGSVKYAVFTNLLFINKATISNTPRALV